MALKQKALKYLADIPSQYGFYSHYYSDKDYYKLKFRRFANEYWRVLSEADAVRIMNYVREILNEE